jgi:hypothetical protein
MLASTRTVIVDEIHALAPNLPDLACPRSRSAPGGVENVINDDTAVGQCRATAVANGLSAPSPSAAMVPSFAE